MHKFLQLHFKILSSFEPENSLESFFKKLKNCLNFYVNFDTKLNILCNKSRTSKWNVNNINGQLLLRLFSTSERNETRRETELQQQFEFFQQKFVFVVFFFRCFFFAQAACIWSFYLSFLAVLTALGSNFFRRDHSFKSVDKNRLAVDITGHSSRLKI